MRQLLVATTNPGKLREIRTLMSSVPLELVSLADIPSIAEPEETGTTFEENARLKASYYAEHSGLLTVAEDSGLVVDALDGEPGVRSARFLRPDASYPERFEEIFRRVDQRPEEPRTARFVAALACVDGGQVIYETTGVVEGEVANTPRGAGGFGYDPIFYYPPFRRTLAEVSEAEKVRVAHRGVAFRAFAAWLKNGPGRSLPRSPL
jgi:XTP/dITP diphosphohydrolase